MRKNLFSFFNIIFVVLLVLSFGCSKYNKPPESDKIIYRAYYKCDKCRSLMGGVWGKGPLEDLRTEKAKTCVHEWVEIDEEEFKNKSKEWKKIK